MNASAAHHPAAIRPPARCPSAISPASSNSAQKNENARSANSLVPETPAHSLSSAKCSGTWLSMRAVHSKMSPQLWVAKCALTVSSYHSPRSGQRAIRLAAPSSTTSADIQAEAARRGMSLGSGPGAGVVRVGTPDLIREAVHGDRLGGRVGAVDRVEHGRREELRAEHDDVELVRLNRGDQRGRIVLLVFVEVFGLRRVGDHVLPGVQAEACFFAQRG